MNHPECYPDHLMCDSLSLSTRVRTQAGHYLEKLQARLAHQLATKNNTRRRAFAHSTMVAIVCTFQSVLKCIKPFLGNLLYVWFLDMHFDMYQKDKIGSQKQKHCRCLHCSLMIPTVSCGSNTPINLKDRSSSQEKIALHDGTV